MTIVLLYWIVKNQIDQRRRQNAVNAWEDIQRQSGERTEYASKNNLTKMGVIEANKKPSIKSGCHVCGYLTCRCGELDEKNIMTLDEISGKGKQ